MRPVGTDGTIYVWLTDSRLIALSPDGTLEWLHTFSNDTGASPSAGPVVISGQGRLYTIVGGRLHALYADGNQVWQAEVESTDWLREPPAVTADGTVLTGTGDGTLRAFTSDGVQDFSFERPWYLAEPFGPPAIGPDGTISVGDSDGILYAIYSNHSTLDASPWPSFAADARNSSQAW